MDNIVLFGASKLGEKAYRLLKENHKIVYFCDNDEKKWGNNFCETEIIKPSDLKRYPNYKIVIASQYYKEICIQLEKMGINDIYVFKIVRDEMSYIKNLNESEIFIDNKQIDVLNIVENSSDTNFEKMAANFLDTIEKQSFDNNNIEDIYVYENISPYYFFRGYYYNILYKVFYYSFFINRLKNIYNSNKIYIKTNDEILFILANQITDLECILRERYHLIKSDIKQLKKIDTAIEISNNNFKNLIINKKDDRENFLVISSSEHIKSMKINSYEMKLFDTFYGKVIDDLKGLYNVIYLRRINEWNETRVNDFINYEDVSVAENIVESYISNTIKNNNLIEDKKIKIRLDLLDKIDFHFDKFNLKYIFEKYILNFNNYNQWIKRVLAFEKFIEEYKIGKIMAIDEYDIREFVVACNRRKIDFYGLQHGYYSKNHYQFFHSKYSQVLAPKKTFVWGEEFKNMFLESSNLFNNDNIFVSGQPISDLCMNYYPNNEAHRHLNVITYISTGIIDIDNMSMNIILQALNLSKKRCDLIIKLHPLDNNYNSYKDILKLYDFENYSIIQHEDLYQIISNSDLIIGICSTVLIESLLFKKNIVSINTKQFGDYNSLAEKGISKLVKNSKDLAAILDNINNLMSTNNKLSDFIFNHFYKIDGKVHDRIIEEIK